MNYLPDKAVATYFYINYMLGQTYRLLGLIIIDGKSLDNTV